MTRRGAAARLSRVLTIFLLAVPVGLATALALGKLGAVDLIYPVLLAFQLAAAAAVLLALSVRAVHHTPRGTAEGLSRPRARLFLVLRLPEILLSVAVVFFLFTFIYATNANMDYVQRFMTSHGNLRLAPDSRAERLTACLRYLPLILLDASWWVGARLARPRLAGRLARGTLGALFPAGAVWALPFAMLSAVLYALSFPSFIRADGIPLLGWVCLLPLLIVFEVAPTGWGIFYGTLFGVLQTMISNYWLGTFDLLTLQFVSVVTLVQYVPFMAVSLLVLRSSGRAGFLVFPAAWTFFDWLRSLGFLGYPWGMLGATQYTFIPLIQVSALTGVWGVTFAVTLCNSVLAWYLQGVLGKFRRGPAAGIAVAAVVAFTLVWGGARIRKETPAPGAPTVRLALIQQNDDPRKDDYRVVFETLRQLTAEAAKSKPDLVVWSETAFVPNIRRWSTEDPKVYPYAALVRDFLAWQRRTGLWLITGNDDYSLVDRNGTQERLDYNGAVLFSPAGDRMETYHKVHLVPFTEYFPYKQQLPGIFALLQSFDAYLWEPGDRRVVFHHPSLFFSTPICFEDVFPDDVRRFVLAGAQAIVNLSNDYWSLTDTEAMQHAANSVFRAVENGVPLARASASGLTCLVSPTGQIVARAPLYQAASLVVDIPDAVPTLTLYTRWGDWFPPSMGVLLLVILAGGLAWRHRR